MRPLLIPTLLLAVLVACNGTAPVPNTDISKDEISDTGGDVQGPDIRYTPSEGAWTMGVDFPVSALVNDDTGILLVTLHYRRQTSSSFDSRGMVLSGEGFYSGVIPGEEQGSAGMHFYIEAVDTVGNSATLPSGAPNDFFKFNLVEE